MKMKMVMKKKKEKGAYGCHVMSQSGKRRLGCWGLLQIGVVTIH